MKTKISLSMLLLFTAYVLPAHAGTPVVVADHLDGPGTLALDGTDIYFADATFSSGAVVNCALKKTSKTGGTVTTLVDNVVLDDGGTYRGIGPLIDVDSNYVYAGYGGYNAYSIFQALKTTGAVSLLFSNSGGYFTGVIGSDMWYGSGFNFLNRRPTSGAAASVALSGYWLRDTAHDSNAIYFQNYWDNTIYKFDANSQIVTALISGNPTGSGGIFIDSNYVYQDISGTIRRVPKAGGAIEDIITTGTVKGIAADGNFVYYVEGGDLKAMPVPVTASSQPIVLASGVAIDSPPFGAIDDSSIYWTSAGFSSPGDGKIWKISKPAPGGAAPWPMFRHDQQHTGLSPVDTSANPGTQKWAFATGKDVYSSPAVGADGTIYVGSSDSHLYAISPDGTQKWAFAAGWEVLSSPAIGADGTIYVGSRDDYLYAINPDGTQKWAFATGGWETASPAIGTDGTIYVGSEGGHFYAINPDGTQKWAFAAPGPQLSSPAIGADGTIYVGSRDNYLYAINPDGTQKWAFATGGWMDSSPAIGADGTIYVGSRDDYLYAVNPNGTQKWAFATGSQLLAAPAIGADGIIYISSADDAHVYAINPDGTQKWAFATGGSTNSSPAIGADGTIYVGAGGPLYAINPDGTQKWAFATGASGGASSPAIGADGTIYIGSGYGLYAVGGASSNTPTATNTPSSTPTDTRTPIATQTSTPTVTPASMVTNTPAPNVPPGTVTATVSPTPSTISTPVPTPLTLKQVKLKAAAVNRNNGSILVRGTFDTGELVGAFGSLGVALRDGLTVGIIGAGLPAPQKIVVPTSQCFDLRRGIECIGTGGEKLDFYRPRSGNLFNLKITARNRSFLPPLSTEGVQVVLSAGGLDRQDHVGSCKVSAGGKSVTCKK